MVYSAVKPGAGGGRIERADAAGMGDFIADIVEERERIEVGADVGDVAGNAEIAEAALRRGFGAADA